MGVWWYGIDDSLVLWVMMIVEWLYFLWWNGMIVMVVGWYGSREIIFWEEHRWVKTLSGIYCCLCPQRDIVLALSAQLIWWRVRRETDLSSMETQTATKTICLTGRLNIGKEKDLLKCSKLNEVNLSSLLASSLTPSLLFIHLFLISHKSTATIYYTISILS